MLVIKQLPRLLHSRAPPRCPKCGRIPRHRRPRPRIVPAWRTPFGTFNTAGKRLLSATTGKRLLSATTGKRQQVATTAADCTCCGPPDCTTCGAGLVTITFSGITFCGTTGCQSNGESEWTGISLNGTYNLLSFGPAGGFDCRYGNDYTLGNIAQVFEPFITVPCDGSPCNPSGDNWCHAFSVSLIHETSTDIWTLSAAVCSAAVDNVFTATFYAPGCPSDPACPKYCFSKTGIANAITCGTPGGDCAGGVAVSGAGDGAYSGGTADVSLTL